VSTILDALRKAEAEASRKQASPRPTDDLLGGESSLGRPRHGWSWPAIGAFAIVAFAGGIMLGTRFLTRNDRRAENEEDGRAAASSATSHDTTAERSAFVGPGTKPANATQGGASQEAKRGTTNPMPVEVARADSPGAVASGGASAETAGRPVADPAGANDGLPASEDAAAGAQAAAAPATGESATAGSPPAVAAAPAAGAGEGATAAPPVLVAQAQAPAQQAAGRMEPQPAAAQPAVPLSVPKSQEVAPGAPQAAQGGGASTGPAASDAQARTGSALQAVPAGAPASAAPPPAVASPAQAPRTQTNPYTDQAGSRPAPREAAAAGATRSWPASPSAPAQPAAAPPAAGSALAGTSGPVEAAGSAAPADRADGDDAPGLPPSAASSANDGTAAAHAGSAAARERASAPRMPMAPPGELNASRTTHSSPRDRLAEMRARRTDGQSADGNRSTRSADDRLAAVRPPVPIAPPAPVKHAAPESAKEAAPSGGAATDNPQPVEPEATGENSPLPPPEALASAVRRSPTGVPQVAINIVQWSASPQRRFAFVTVDGSGMTQVHEGDQVGGLTVKRIYQRAVEFGYNDTSFLMRTY